MCVLKELYPFLNIQTLFKCYIQVLHVKLEDYLEDLTIKLENMNLTPHNVQYIFLCFILSKGKLFPLDLDQHCEVKQTL